MCEVTCFLSNVPIQICRVRDASDVLFELPFTTREFFGFYLAEVKEEVSSSLRD